MYVCSHTITHSGVIKGLKAVYQGILILLTTIQPLHKNYAQYT